MMRKTLPMNIIRIIFYSFVCFVSCNENGTGVEEQVLDTQYVIRAASYNVLHGAGVDSFYCYHPAVAPEYQRNRLEDIIKNIKAIDPDIIGIQEASSWQLNNEEVARYVAGQLNMNYYLGESIYDHPVVIYTKYEILDTTSYKQLFTRSGQFVKLKTTWDDTLYVVNVHLEPNREENSEYNSLLDIIDPLKNFKSILMGDLNRWTYELPEGWVNGTYAREIDHIIVTTKLDSFMIVQNSIQLPIARASDHRPVILDVGLN